MGNEDDFEVEAKEHSLYNTFCNINVFLCTVVNDQFLEIILFKAFIAMQQWPPVLCHYFCLVKCAQFNTKSRLFGSLL